MFAVVPPSIAHFDEKKTRTSIYSAHLHPDGILLATGGLDTKIRIWNVEAVVEDPRQSLALSGDAPSGTRQNVNKAPAARLLSTLALHNGIRCALLPALKHTARWIGAVLCVRFSNLKGTYLASGSDGDNIVMIWQRDESPHVYGGTVFGSEETNVESWKCVKRLAGHQSDVVDLAWSPDNSLLATCGLDRSILIWDGSSFDRIQRLSAHHGFVKGLAWDPVGKYLASQSDDRSVVIWNTADWSVFKQIFSRFEKPMGETFFKRLTWSPDGSQICAVHAVDQSQLISTASIVSRESWQEDACLVGHRGVIECASYNPRMYKASSDLRDENGNPEEMGGIWSVCALGSQDGSVSFWSSSSSRPAVVVHGIFSNTIFDIGWNAAGTKAVACSADGTVALFLFESDSFGTPVDPSEVDDALAKYGKRNVNRDKLIPEFPSQLMMEDRFREHMQQTRPPAPLPSHSSTMTSATSARFQELMSGPSGFDQPTSSVQNSFATTLQMGTAMTIKRADSAASATSTATTLPLTPTAPRQQPASNQPLSVHTTSAAAQQQKITITKDGRKRLQPIFLHSPSVASQPSGASATGAKRSMDSVEQSIMQEEVAIKKRILELIREQENIRIDDRVVDLPIPKIVPQMQFVLGSNIHIVVENPKSSAQPFVSVACQRDGYVLWTEHLSKPVLQLVGSMTHNLVAIATSDNSLYTFFADSGRRLLPRLRLDGRASFVDMNEGMFALVTESGHVWTWMLAPEPKCLLHGVTIAPLFPDSTEEDERTTREMGSENEEAEDGGFKLVSFRVHPSGRPIVSLSDRSVHMYDARLQSWVRVDGTEPMDLFSDSFAGTQPVTKKVGLMGGTTKSGWWNHVMVLQQLTVHNVSKEMQQKLSLSHLEDQMAVARLLGDQKLQERLVQLYAIKISDVGDLARAQQLCAELCKDGSTEESWEVLRNVLSCLARNRRFQRLVHSYQQMMDQRQRQRKDVDDPMNSVGDLENDPLHTFTLQ